MKIGIIGAGQIGGTLTRRLRALGHEVHVANSRDPRTLASLVTETGAVAVEAKEAPRGVDLVIVTIPERNVPTLPKGLFAGVMQRLRPSSCSLSTSSVSMPSMPADWTTPGGSNPEHQCTPPISMLKACGRHFRRHAANAHPIGPPRPKAPATLPIRRERRVASVASVRWPRPPRLCPSALTATRTFFCGDTPISLCPTCVRGADPSAPQHRYAPRHARKTP